MGETKKVSLEASAGSVSQPHDLLQGHSMTHTVLLRAERVTAVTQGLLFEDVRNVRPVDLVNTTEVL